MNNTTDNILAVDDDGFRVSVDTGRLGAAQSAPLATRGKHERKYNIKVRQDDLLLLDALARQQEIPRSLLLNNLLHEILLDELMSIEEHDVRLLLAQAADGRAHYDELSRPWIFDAISAQCGQLIDNMSAYNQAVLDVQEEPNAPADISWNSEKYLAIREMLEQMNK